MTWTQEQIVSRIIERKENDMFVFEWAEYVPYLDFKHAKQFLKEGCKEEGYIRAELSKEVLEKTIKDYMEFAWEKANGGRELSANRSIMHLIAWIWLSGADKFAEEIDNEYTTNYHYYGKDILAKICAHYGIDSKQWDNGERTN